MPDPESLGVRMALDRVRGASALAGALRMAHRMAEARRRAARKSRAAKIEVRLRSEPESTDPYFRNRGDASAPDRLPPSGFILSRGEFERVWDELMVRAAELLVKERGPQLGGLGRHLSGQQVERVRHIAETYWMPTMQVGPPRTLMELAGFLRNVTYNLDFRQLPLPTVITLRQLAKSMHDAVREAASAFEDLPTIGPTPRGMTVRRSRVPPLEGLTEIRQGPFAALFFSVEYLATGGDRKRAIEKAKLGAVADQMASMAAGVQNMRIKRATVRRKMQKSALTRDTLGFVDALRGTETIVGTEAP